MPDTPTPRGIRALLRGEPVLAGHVVAIVLAIAAIVGLDVDEGQVAAVVAAVLAALAWLIRHFTTPASDPAQPDAVKPTTRL